MRFSNITFDEVMAKNLNVMDMTAFTLCKENNLPIIVFDMNKDGNLQRLLSGESIGTLVSMHGGEENASNGRANRRGRNGQRQLAGCRNSVIQPSNFQHLTFQKWTKKLSFT